MMLTKVSSMFTTVESRSRRLTLGAFTNTTRNRPVTKMSSRRDSYCAATEKLLSARQDDVFFCPGVDLPAMGTGEFWRFDFCCGPEPFFDGLTGGSEFGGGRAPNE